jgi:hypothetical protein
MTLNELTQEKKKYLERLLLISKAKRDPWTFISEFVYTLDEHEKSGDPIKKFPSHRYLRLLVRIFQRNDRVLVPKSRQLMISWVCCAYLLWLALFHKGKLIAIQKVTAEDANDMLDRVKFIYNHLPSEMKQPDANSIFGKLEFPSINSKIISVKQGKDQLSGKTCSAIFSDEMSKQVEADEAYFASKPTIDGGGIYIGVGTPNGEDFFYYLVHDIENDWKGYEHA